MTNSRQKQLLYDLFQAYYDARRNKRNTVNALNFEANYEQKLFKLHQEIVSGKYELGESVCFISFKPVQREIFAASFRDRIVHHLIYNYISPVFERYFINDAYSCRTGKGTSYGIKRLDHFIRSCSQNYHQDCYILKLDIKGYFMAMDRSVLYKKTAGTLRKALGGGLKANFDFELILRLIRRTIFHDSVKRCRIKGKRSDWAGLPKSKSLFFALKGCGLPIGNLTSQLFGNVYLNDFDHFVKHGLGIKYYGRYVDDMVIVHENKKFLKSIIPKLRKYLCHDLELELHPNKIYLQHFSKGVSFLGVIIKPYRVYIRNRTKGNFYQVIKKWNDYLAGNGNKLSLEEVKRFISVANSYLGLMKHYKTRKLRKKILNQLSIYFWNYVFIKGDYEKLSLRKNCNSDKASI